MEIDKNKEKRKDLTSLIISSIVMIITLFSFFFTSSEEIPPQTYIIFGIIVVVILLGFFIFAIIQKWNGMNSKITGNQEQISEFQKSLNTKKLYDDMDKRISILENLINKLFLGKNKKGQAIDPRILFWILLIILLLLFLKSIGIF
jgi:quinol-cytochrome oxidoreductase complex cytochrome b subunit